jgi:hypothetical protein
VRPSVGTIADDDHAEELEGCDNRKDAELVRDALGQVKVRQGIGEASDGEDDQAKDREADGFVEPGSFEAVVVKSGKLTRKLSGLRTCAGCQISPGGC